jgi:MoxR-like ATPase
MSSALAAINNIKTTMQQVVIGQNDVIDKIIIGLLCNGNLLLEGLPGTAKTRAVKTLATAIEADLGRIQFTPDLLPSDVTGTDVYHVDGDSEQLSFQPGPIFANLVLADEVNRAPAKVQAALLEAMEERQVTVSGKSYKLPELFMVLATQNPVEQEGTYPLPEAQMDRFLMKLTIDYPEDDAELGVIRLVRGEEKSTGKARVKIDQKYVFTAREEIRNLHIAENVEKYIVALIMATRRPERYADSELQNWIEVGSSPRASIGLDKAARAHAWLAGKAFVDPDDVRAVVVDVLRHRLVLSYQAIAEGISSDDVIKEIVKQVAVA